MRVLLCVVVTLALARAATAEPITAMEVEGFNGVGRSAGYATGFQFTPSSDLSVTHGGFWDWGADGNPDSISEVDWVSFSIFEVATRTYLYRETLHYSTSTLEGPTTGGPGSFRYQSLTDTVLLEAGTDYLALASSGAGWVLVFPESFGSAPHLSIEQNSGSVVRYGNTTYQAYPGANFKYEPVAVPVPEPSTAVLLLLSGALFCTGRKWSQRRRRLSVRAE